MKINLYENLLCNISMSCRMVSEPYTDTQTWRTENMIYYPDLNYADGTPALPISISTGNRKMGQIPSVSLPPHITCRPDAPCRDLCYARKAYRMYPSVRDAYQRNLAAYMADRDVWTRSIAQWIDTRRIRPQALRLNVSGDAPDATFFWAASALAEACPDVQILQYTKAHDWAASYCAVLDWTGLDRPANYRLLLSTWPGLETYNPHNLPTANVTLRDGRSTARPGDAECPGNCSACLASGSGCYGLGAGQGVHFWEH